MFAQTLGKRIQFDKHIYVQRGWSDKQLFFSHMPCDAKIINFSSAQNIKLGGGSKTLCLLPNLKRNILDMLIFLGAIGLYKF